MTDKSIAEAFVQRMRRGRAFEDWERARWKGEEHEAAEFEASTSWKGRRGRMDIRLVDSEEGHTIVVEIKATDWDAMKPHRVRPNALRHARQTWRYIEAELADRLVLPALVYPRSPTTEGRKDQIERILNNRGIQVVWRDEQDK